MIKIKEIVIEWSWWQVILFILALLLMFRLNTQEAFNFLKLLLEHFQ